MTGLPLLAFWVHTPHPFLIQFTDTIGIRYYGLAYLMGFVVAGWLFRRYHRTGLTPLDGNASTDLMVALVLGVIVGGRLGFFLLYQPEELFNPPWAFFLVWKGGMASHGGFVGVCAALAWFAHRRKFSFLHLSDLVVSIAPAGLLFGRLANFINGELWGKISVVRWAIIFKNSGGGPMPRHPSQLYEAALEGALLLGYMQWRIWGTDVTKRQPGRLAGEFLIGYALVRIFCELFREPDLSRDGLPDLIHGLSRGTFYSIFMILAGVILVFRRPKATAHTP
jgi:phosphatidylglycerol:prolipoprotein diacylglycerol transferase